MTDLFTYLRERSYPGRGILLGATPTGKSVCVYFIMGRSENSRNRVFEATENGLRTRAFDESKVEDPSLILYNAVCRRDEGIIVTNGAQTDVIEHCLMFQGTFEQALRGCTFEPDSPNFTPRISGMLSYGRYQLSILKTLDGNPSMCQRFFYEYEPLAGIGHFISTYEGFGSPLPSFSGEPVCVEIPDVPTQTLAARLWDALNADNKVSLYVEIGGEEPVIINKNV